MGIDIFTGVAIAVSGFVLGVMFADAYKIFKQERGKAKWKKLDKR